MLLAGCLEEGTDGCAAYMSFVFQHRASVEGFDGEIANDVYLHIYRDDILHRTLRVPYGEIAGGREYRVKKEFTGRLSVAAWAVLPDGDVSIIPSAEINGRYSTAEIAHTPATRAAEYYHPLTDLYLGRVDVDSNKEEESVYVVDMVNTTCGVTVNVHTDIFFDPADGDAAIYLDGPASKCNLDLTPTGGDAVVRTAAGKKSDRTFTTNRFNVLPTPTGRTLSVRGMSGENETFLVVTDETASPGDEITIDIYGAEAFITINGWRSKYTVLQL